MLPQMALTSNLALVSLLLCFSFYVNPQPFFNPTASTPVSWTNSPSITDNFTFEGGEIVRPILLRLNTTGGMSFATGFYCFPPCKGFFLSIYIIYAYKYEYGFRYQGYSPQVIWSANQAHPVSENATLQLTSKDGLTLRDSDGSLVWSTNVMNRWVAGVNITEAGNLVLFDINNSTIWQSIDHPTDCLVMGQTLAGGVRIISNSSSTDLAESRLYLTLLANGLYGFVDSDPPLIYYYSYTYRDQTNHFYDSNRTVDKSIFIKFMDGKLSMFSTLSDNDLYTSFFEFPTAKSIQYMRLESDGHLRLYDFDDYRWTMVADLLNLDTCDYPMVCGHYGICNNGQCICPKATETSENYFKPVDKWRPELGCSVVTNITCQDANNHHMLDLNYVSSFNNVDNVAFKGTDEETCKKACLGDCKCKAALFQSDMGNSSIGTCYTLPEVFSLKNIPQENFFNSSAYIKVQVSPSSSFRLGRILGSTFGALLFMLTLITIYIVCLRRREEAQDEKIIEQLPGMPTRFTFEELRGATENFVKILGKGGFGTVYDGRSGDERIAVKRLDNIRHGKKDFLAEAEIIGSIHHINLVRLIGFCANELNRLLVYGYMCNGSLDQWIYCKDGRVPLDWPIRFKIITDIAMGLCYLHEDCRHKIVHFDIKPANILLDENFNAKISDFGLSKLINRDISKVMTKMRGTPGYLAPEWLTSMVTEKVDVYSFGVVVMEILSGRRNLDDSQTEENYHLIRLLENISKNNALSDLIDKNLSDVELYEKEIVNVMKLAMWCLQWDSTRRPSMSMVVKVLKGAMEVETSLDYNFVTSIPIPANVPGVVDQSAPLLASVLSGPR